MEYNKPFILTFEDYLLDAKSQLCCNASDEYKSECITYDYTNEDIDNNKEYFNGCYKDGLSAYKALLFLGDYLEELNSNQ